MKILFVNALLNGDFTSIDIGITQLATYINKKTQHSANIADLVFHRKNWKRHLKKCITKYKPDIIGMSSNTLYMNFVRIISEEIRKKFNLPIILGGHHTSLNPLETLNIPGVNAICIGDGLICLPKFLDNYEKGRSVKGIKGIWAKESNRIIKNDKGRFFENIDSLPALDWNLWSDLKKYLHYIGLIYSIGNLGCIYRCTYCDAYPLSKCSKGNYYRIRNPAMYANEILFQWDKYRSKGMRMAWLYDSIPTINQKWLKKFCDEYKTSGKVDEYKYSMYSRIDNLNKEKIIMLAKSGCTVLRFGVEAGNDFIRNDIYKKNISKAKIKQVFKLCKEYGISTTAFYLVGGPGETRDTINETINFSRQLDANISMFFTFKPFTQKSKNCIYKFGGKIYKKRWRDATHLGYDAVIGLKDVSPKQIENMLNKGYSFAFNRRRLKLLSENPIKYNTRLVKYMLRGLKDGLDLKYLWIYFHLYGYDYVTK